MGTNTNFEAYLSSAQELTKKAGLPENLRQIDNRTFFGTYHYSIARWDPRHCAGWYEPQSSSCIGKIEALVPEGSRVKMHVRMFEHGKGKVDHLRIQPNGTIEAWVEFINHGEKDHFYLPIDVNLV
ncbi:MAG: hypothetical protein HZB66_01480 [Candidatus Aenigmarchaeota archaeon]|nr:hypothetical protein [Candidatus Aenigmarchaeota archaeon]